MSKLPRLPTYQDDLAVFVGQLRDLLFSSQEETAAYFHLDRSRISRYETGRSTPKIGYVAGLAQLIAQREGNVPEVQQALFQEINKVVVSRHYGKSRFRNWEALCDTADAYLAERRAKHAARISSATPEADLSDGARQSALEERLEKPTYTQLIGVEDHLDSLLRVLASPEPPWLISIEGFGGLGKTSLAHALSRRVIQQRLFDDFGWVSARQYVFHLGEGIKPVGLPAVLTVESLVERLVAQLMPDTPRSDTLFAQQAQAILKRRLKRIPHLIVIDNLETVEDIEVLLPILRELANPTKFLLTSRESLYHESGVYHFPLPELSETNALRLIRYETELHNLTHLKQASDDDLKRIFEIVGGNPLAIRLVVGQTHRFALDVILEDLAQAQGQTVEELYTFVYRRSWEALDAPARTLFLAMPLITDEGESLEGLVELSELDAATARHSLKQLIDLNLVNSFGDHKERYYSIHNLTRTFLLNQVLRWK
ncbi:MAG: NB-ARC domain-containing protein [Anaerolineae bacterium]